MQLQSIQLNLQTYTELYRDIQLNLLARKKMTKNVKTQRL